jgi:hypothetical protein
MINERAHKPSATCLTGLDSQAGLYHHFKQFNKDSRINKFKVEDFYYIRNGIALKKDPSLIEPDNREVIHVMIDYASLQSLGTIENQNNNSQKLNY